MNVMIGLTDAKFRIARQCSIEFTLDKRALLFKGDFEAIIKVSQEDRIGYL